MRHVMLAELVTFGAGAAPPKSTAALDPWELVMSASPVVMMVMLLLAGMSLACWFIIGAKLVSLSKATRESASFLRHFWDPEQGNVWNVKRLENLYASIGARQRSPLANVFHAGYVELARVLGGDRQSQLGPGQKHYGGDIDNIARSLRRAQQSEVTNLEAMVPFLATTGSTAPFVGLFGTVWGIMNSFISIGAQKNASLDVVAPGIAEALIATAAGLAAAIPALMAYNHFAQRIRVLAIEMDNFSHEFLNIAERHFFK
jgi:biopolymer transport protein TolQ